MNDLEIAKRIAEIEGIKLTLEVSTCSETGDPVEWYSYHSSQQAFCDEEYTPFEWSILGPLKIKYKVEIDFDIDCVGAWVDKPRRYFSIDFSSEKEIPRAILECIIKSQECK